MPKGYPLSALIALTAIAAAPAFAQTSASSPHPSNPSTTSTVTSTPGMPPVASPTGTVAMRGDSSTYVTTDKQLRASKMLGSSVYDSQKTKIGTVDELLLDNNHDVTSAVLSVGGFLGIGSKLVKVPYSDLRIAGDTIVMPSATKDQLSHMPDYSYSGAT